MKIFVIATLSTLLLTGCFAKMKVYTADPDAPQANIRNSMEKTKDFRNSIKFSVFNIDECKAGSAVMNYQGVFAETHSSNTYPVEYTAIRADKRLMISYHEDISADRYCQIDVITTFDTGGEYSIHGGFSFKEGFLPFLPGKRQCHFGIMNDKTGRPHPLIKAENSIPCE